MLRWASHLTFGIGVLIILSFLSWCSIVNTILPILI